MDPSPQPPTGASVSIAALSRRQLGGSAVPGAGPAAGLAAAAFMLLPAAAVAASGACDTTNCTAVFESFNLTRDSCRDDDRISDDENKFCCDPEKDSTFFIIGCCLALVGSTGESLGFTYMHLAHDREHQTALSEGRPERLYLKIRLWWFGLAIFIMGNILDFVAFGFTGQTVVILVGCWALCVNLYTAPIILNESRTMMDLVAALFIMLGIGMAVGSGNYQDRAWTTCEILERYEQPGSIVVLLIIFGICLVAYAATRVYHKAHPIDAFQAKQLKDGSSGVGITEQLEPGAEEAVKYEQPKVPKSIGIGHILLSAMVATLTVCTAKATSEMIVQTAAGDGNQFSGWGFLIILIFLCSLPMQLHFIQVSMKVNDALLHIPVFYVFWQIGSTITAGVIYEEFDGYEDWQWALYCIGVCLLVFGIKIASGRLGDVEAAMAAAGDDKPPPPAAVGGYSGDTPSAETGAGRTEGSIPTGFKAVTNI